VSVRRRRTPPRKVAHDTRTLRPRPEALLALFLQLEKSTPQTKTTLDLLARELRCDRGQALALLTMAKRALSYPSLERPAA
jgi:hypothetical protein